MSPSAIPQKAGLVTNALQALDDLNGGVQHGFRPVHAKGLLLSGMFTPAPDGQSLTHAPHLQRNQTEVTVRLSDFAGIPAIPDNDPNASPRGIAIRFHLGEHVHTDIIAHSENGFPTRTAEEFIEFLRAIHASGPDAPRPSPIEAFLAAHPAALKFVQDPKPFPASFAGESFFGVSAYRFTSAQGASVYGRYRIRPEANPQYLDPDAAATKPANYLFDELKERIAKSAVGFRILVQLANEGDIVDDATINWPEDRTQVDFGRIELTAIKPENDVEQRHIIFDPLPRVDGIEASADPLLEPRADIYLASGRRRRRD